MIHAHTSHFSSAKKFYIQESRLGVIGCGNLFLRLVQACGTVLPSDWYKLTKRVHLKENFINYSSLYLGLRMIMLIPVL